MLEYRGKYRVCYEIDKKDKPLESTFIPCGIAKKSNIYRYDDNTLSAYIPSVKTGNRILKESPNIFTLFQQGESETVLLFKESEIEKAALILKARTKGKNISPRSKRNVIFVQKVGVIATL